MGNCLKHPSSASQYSIDEEEEEEEEGGDWDCSAARDDDGGGKTTEVKIKITKKQLEALLLAPPGKVSVKDLRVEQILAQLMAHSDRFQAHQRPWRPALQSIPELN
ncbi:DUF4228 domain protein [Senna tora]|uniref:DUF4228 domain protein n=1 Tax=Senna tora TaxID=362788 RepID=A0A834WPN0_9FABA|nr:DUF4228 domain protein [Senna tora]